MLFIVFSSYGHLSVVCLAPGFFHSELSYNFDFIYNHFCCRCKTITIVRNFGSLQIARYLHFLAMNCCFATHFMTIPVHRSLSLSLSVYDSMQPELRACEYVFQPCRLTEGSTRLRTLDLVHAGLTRADLIWSGVIFYFTITIIICCVYSTLWIQWRPKWFDVCFRCLRGILHLTGLTGLTRGATNGLEIWVRGRWNGANDSRLPNLG